MNTRNISGMLLCCNKKVNQAGEKLGCVPFDKSNKGLLIRDLLNKFRDRKEREIRNWICNLGNPSQTRALCMADSQEVTRFLMFDKLCDYTM